MCKNDQNFQYINSFGNISHIQHIFCGFFCRTLKSWQQQREGHGDYGCWFSPALGSGIFLNLGRTRLLYKKGDVGALYDDWRTRRGSDVAADESELARLQGILRGEAFPLMAADLSYDSVVLLHNSVSRALCWSSNPGL